MTRRQLMLTYVLPHLARAAVPVLSALPLNGPLRRFGRWLAAEDRSLERADVIVVLGGGSIGRVRLGAEMYRRGAAPLAVVYTNADGNQFGDTPSRSTVEEALRLGVAAADLVHDTTARITWDEARHLRRLMEASVRRTAIVITDGYHLRRARLIFGETFRDTGTRLAFYGTGAASFDPEGWWRRRADTTNVLAEAMGLLIVGAGLIRPVAWRTARRDPHSEPVQRCEEERQA